MHTFLTNLLPTLDSLGVWSYWIIGLFSFLEGWWVTGVIAPGTLVVDAGGALVGLGHLDFFDLVWFVAIGAIIGGEVSWHSGQWLGSRVRLPQGKTFQRAQDLVRRRGPIAVVIGRFLGPVAGLAALAAALSGMKRRQFVIWNIASGFIYALAHVAMASLAGTVLGRITPYLPRIVLPLGALAVIIAVTWLITRQIRRGWPILAATLEDSARRLADWPPAQRLAARHPRTAAFIQSRVHLRDGSGLMTTAIFALLIYLTGVFIDNAFDLTFVPETAALDHRVANLAHAYWSDAGLRIAGWLTQLGHVPVAATMAAGAVAALALWGRRAAAIGLAVSVAGNAVTVTLLKLAFGRARPELGYFLESSNSFPSGHAGISVALYACLFVMLWRERLIGPTLALIAGIGIAATIGLTRIYLIEHYLSDVLNGWVIGAIWLVIGFAIAETLRRGRFPARPPIRAAAAGVLVLALAGAGWIAVTHQPTMRQAQAASGDVLTDVAATVTADGYPLAVMTLTGEDLPPVSLIVEGDTPEALAARLSAAGWTAVPAPGMASILAALRQEVSDRPRTDATVPPAFRDTLPAAITLRAPSGASVLRLWPAGQTPSGAPIVAGALAPEADLAEWSEAAVRGEVLSQLPGQVEMLPSAQVSGKTDLYGTPWSTDGQIALVTMPQTAPPPANP